MNNKASRKERSMYMLGETPDEQSTGIFLSKEQGS